MWSLLLLIHYKQLLFNLLLGIYSRCVTVAMRNFYMQFLLLIMVRLLCYIMFET